MGESAQALTEFLVHTPFFGGLEDASLDLLVTMLVERTYPAGTAVFREGDTGRSMYVITSGRIVMCRTGDSGHQVRLVRLNPGDFFGETTLIEMQPRPCGALVESDAHLLELSNRSLYQLYREDVKAYVLVLQNINRELCRRLRKADARITEIADESGDEVTQICESPRLRPTRL